MCVLSVHYDKRVRIWDLADGRCVNISQFNCFKDEGQITCGTPLRKKNARFFVFAGIYYLVDGIIMLLVFKKKNTNIFYIYI